MDGNEIRAGRKRLGFTQGQFAEKLGVGPRTVGSWERGETVPKNKMSEIIALFRKSEREDDGSDEARLRDFSDLALLSELMRRTVDRD